MRLRKKIQPLLWIMVTTAAIVIAGYYFTNKVFIPQNFTESRAKSSEVSREIVSLIEESLKNLEEISFQDRHYNFQTAIKLVQKELVESKETQTKALKLNTELGLMTGAAAGITPAKARNLALESISYEITLVSRLVSYNATLNALLQTLEFKFSGDIRYDADDVQKLVKNMNEEAKEINKLNNLFNEKMKALDQLVK